MPENTAGVEECPECGKLVNRGVNGSWCPYCHAETFVDGGAT